jgi:hypothetical protein
MACCVNRFHALACRGPSESKPGNLTFKRSTVVRHPGVVGLRTGLWLPNRPPSSTAPSKGTVRSYRTGTKYSLRSGSSTDSRW